MTPERHERLQRLFEAAVDLPAGERADYLSEVCAGDAELRRELDELIAADARPAGETVNVCPVCSRCYASPIKRCPLDGALLEHALDGPLLIGGKYEIEARLGHGGMGDVYRVRHIALGKIFALKMVLTDRAPVDWYRESFEREARALGRMKHPNIVLVTDYGIHVPADIPYLVMEYLEGEPLGEILKRRLRIPYAEAAPMLRMIATAIDFAHEQDIVHGDLKPSNLFVCGSDIKVIDFGLARFQSGARTVDSAAPIGISGDESLVTATLSDRLCGTPAFMAPELFRFEPPSKASDRFAFGVLVYQILTGRLPFGPNGCHDANARLDPPAPSACPNDADVSPGRGSNDASNRLPAELDAPILALLDPIPRNRPATALGAVKDMEAAWLAARQRYWRAHEVPRRLGVSAASAAAIVMIAALVAQIPMAKTMEGRSIDVRFGISPKAPPDPRVLVVAIDESSLAEDPRPLAEWAGPLGLMIDRVFAGGAHAVALDLILGDSAARSPEFNQAVLRHKGHLTLGIESHNANVIGTEAIARPAAYLLGDDAYLKLFGFVDLQEDADHVIRRAFAASNEGSVSFAARAAGVDRTTADPFWIDYSTRPGDIPVMPWRAALAADPQSFRDRIILVGATFAGSNDEWTIPSSISDAKIPGVVLQAEIANTILRNYPVRSLGFPAWLIAAGAACFTVIAFALRYPYRFGIPLTLTGTAAGAYALAVIAIFQSSKVVAPLVAPEFSLLLAAAAAWALKSRLAPYPGKEP